MKRILFIISIILVFAFNNGLKAQELLDKSDAPQFFTMGARIGLNTSNRTFPSGYYNQWNHDSWGTGFDIGVVANLNFKEFLSIQPGIFYQSRSGNYAYFTEYLDYRGREEEHYELGHRRGYYFTIPILGILKLNIAENVKCNIEFGPYFQIRLKETGQDDVAVLYRLPQSNLYSQYKAKSQGWDIGLKMGTGLQFYQHYYVGVHYLAGLCNAWQDPSGGKNKAWEFTIGYDF